MGILDRLTSKPVLTELEHCYPPWVTNGTPSTRKLYDAALSELKRINELSAGNRLKISSCRLVLAQIARLAGKDKSLLNVRRQPELCFWIAEKNVEIIERLKAHKLLAPRVKKELSVTQLKLENSKLKKQLNLGEQLGLRNVVEEFFSSNLLSNREDLVRENSRLKMEIESKEEIITKMRSIQREQHEMIANIIKILTPQQRASITWLGSLHGT
jgi:hypothetical protein